MSSLILVRHGQSVWNLQNRFTGWVDVELSKNGIKEAQKSGDLIKTLNLNFDLYFTSYLKRSIKTLEIILDVLKVNNPIILKAWELNERHYGGLTSLNTYVSKYHSWKKISEITGYIILNPKKSWNKEDVIETYLELLMNLYHSNLVELLKYSSSIQLIIA